MAPYTRTPTPDNPPSANAPAGGPGLISEHGLGQVLPPTAVKPPVKAKPAPTAKPPAGTAPPGTPPPASTTPSLTSPDGTQTSQFGNLPAMVKAAIQPILDEYQNQIDNIDKQDTTTRQFDTDASQQLGDWLSKLGDSSYTPSMAALLGQQASRIQNYNDFNAKQNVFNQLIGGANGLSAQIPGILKSYTDSSTANLTLAGTLMKQYAGTVPPPAIQTVLQGLVGYKPGSMIPQSYNGKTPALPKYTKVVDASGKVWFVNPVTGVKQDSGIVTNVATGSGTLKPGGNGHYWFFPKAGGAPRDTGVAIPAKGTPAGQRPQLRQSKDGSYVWVYPPSAAGGAPKVVSAGFSGKVGKGSGSGNGGGMTADAYQKFLDKLKIQPTQSVTEKGVGKNAGQTITKTLPDGSQPTRYRYSYPAAYRLLVNKGMDPARVRSDLDQIYGRGQGGRAWLTNNEQNALKTKGLPTAAYTISIPGQGQRSYITQDQLVALRDHDLYPPVKAVPLPYNKVPQNLLPKGAHMIPGGSTPMLTVYMIQPITGVE